MKLKKIFRKKKQKIRSLCKKLLFSIFLISNSLQIAFAEDDIFTKAKTMFNSIYKSIAGIATVTAGTMAAICLFLMFFSKSPKTVEESTGWLKRIALCWLGIMLISSIIYYFTSSSGLNISETVTLIK